MAKKLIYLIPLVLMFSCQLDSDDYFTNPYEILYPAMLTEYEQGGELIYSFSYNGWRINTMTRHRQYGDLVFQFEYDAAGFPVRAAGIYSDREFIYHFEYQDGKLDRIIQAVDDYEWKTISFKYNQEGKIIESIEVAGTSTRIKEFEWEGNNISRVTAYNSSSGRDFARINEFEYDDKYHPMQTPFHFVGYNLVSDLPIVENNWKKQISYNQITSTSKDVTDREFEYYAHGFPLKNTFRYIDMFGDEQEVVTEFMY